MKTSIVTFEQVSKEIKTQISKLGKDQLVKNFQTGRIGTTEALVAARHYLLKRESMTETEIDDFIEKLYGELLAPAKKAAPKATKSKTTPAKKADDIVIDDVKTATIEKVKVEKVAEDPIIKLTAQEFPLFESIKKAYKKTKEVTMAYKLIDKAYENYREFKGVLGSLMKKDIVSYDQDGFTILELGLKMIEGEIAYKEKAKNEQNFFKTKRLVIEVDGKSYEKSAFVRMRLRKNNTLTCVELNAELAALGFGKLYHSELQRCKDQLGIVTVKDKD